jgi:hypothetical protein
MIDDLQYLVLLEKGKVYSDSNSANFRIVVVSIEVMHVIDKTTITL